MLKIQKFVCNMLQENCYVVSDETKECVIVDCGAFYNNEQKAIKAYIEKEGLTPVHLLSTHGHIDHNFGNRFIYDTYHLKAEVPAPDEWLMESLADQAVTFIGVRPAEPYPPVGRYLSPQDTILFGSHKIEILSTPGHTPGSVVYYLPDEHTALTGDTLFHLSIGRTDFERGSMMQMMQSLRSLAQLPDETIVLSGHGQQTTIGDELRMNPFMDR